MPSTATGSLPVPVYMITGTSGEIDWIWRSRVSPSVKRSW